jgi:hypothetical protein
MLQTASAAPSTFSRVNSTGFKPVVVQNRDELQLEVETGEDENFQNKPRRHFATSRSGTLVPESE